jgi:hypothetical protein
MLFTSGLNADDGLDVLRELNDVHLVGDQRVLSRAVTLEEDLLDEFFT